MTDRLNEIKSYWEKANRGDGGWWAHAMAHAPADLEWLIEELERGRADFAELMKRKERSKAMLEKCLWILNTVCDGIHDYPEIESEPVRDELFLFLHNHLEWVKRYGESA